MHIRGISASALTAIVATGDFLFDDGPASCAIRLVDGLGSLGKLVGVNRLVAILDERLDVVLYLLECLRILFGEPLSEILRERGGW
ncbi:hypothetical protein C465_01414 [Halorubrum distributum JCM 9100]|uniref:Uncharacterized protein n=2 Tax=Halorubrum distributum TaxID=29283 RepID=M0F3D7_9EURY|nr:hypothetical protein C466_15734 [Halorubrum distributum JCM 10118]ELZ53164.1 hypothetical protein C465_01414 [Halorubrum distributum JCM 9100]